MLLRPAAMAPVSPRYCEAICESVTVMVSALVEKLVGVGEKGACAQLSVNSPNTRMDFLRMRTLPFVGELVEASHPSGRKSTLRATAKGALRLPRARQRDDGARQE